MRCGLRIDVVSRRLVYACRIAYVFVMCGVNGSHTVRIAMAVNHARSAEI